MLLGDFFKCNKVVFCIFFIWLNEMIFEMLFKIKLWYLIFDICFLFFRLVVVIINGFIGGGIFGMFYR